jgi:hypothetical protein
MNPKSKIPNRKCGPGRNVAPIEVRFFGSQVPHLFSIRGHSWLKPRFVKKYFETTAMRGEPVRLFQIGLSWPSPKNMCDVIASAQPRTDMIAELIFPKSYWQDLSTLERAWAARERSSPKVKAGRPSALGKRMSPILPVNSFLRRVILE